MNIKKLNEALLKLLEDNNDLHVIWNEQMKREPVLDTQDGPIYLQVSDDGKFIEFGTLTNNGMIVEGSVEYDFDSSLDRNLEEVAEEVYELHEPIYEDGSEPYSDSKFDRLNDLFSESLNEIAMKRYLYMLPEGLCLFEGDKCIDRLDINVPTPWIELTDEDVRRYAKKVFPNITDDIEVKWY